jgi:hypothetical protein
VCPLQVRRVTRGSRTYRLLQSKNKGEDDTNGANDDVGVAEERVLAAEPGGGGEDNVFVATEASDVVSWKMRRLGRRKE